MTVDLMRFVPAFFFFALLQSSSFGQTDEQMARVFEWKFVMNAPDADFIPMAETGGWEEPATASKVVCMATPVPYDRMVNDLGALGSEDGQQVLDKKVVDINGVSGLLMLMEFSPVAGEDTEVVYTLMFTRPFEDFSLVLNAQYPKSEHDRLYSKMLASFGSVRKKDN